MRRIIIGAIGGDFQSECACSLGQAVASAGLILLTGGDGRDPSQVKDAAMYGASHAGPNIPGRRIGILPDRAGPKREATDKTELPLFTELPHFLRNLINGVTPDALVAFGGSCGTLAELAFALAAARPVRYFGKGEKGPAVDRLRGNLNKLREPENFACYLERPLQAWHGAIDGKAWDAAELFALLECHLGMAKQWEGNAAELVARSWTCLGRKETALETGFPGIPGMKDSKDHFEQAVRILSE